jgi:FkbM family methyltransferase
MFFDIGANVGEWSKENIKLADKIIAVEASPNTFNLLKTNTNNYSNINCLNYAVSSCNNDHIDFYDCTANTISTTNIKWLTDPNSRFYNYKYNTIKVRTITIDELIKTYGIPDLIKVDVEGGEYDCLKSLTQKIPLLCFEWASEVNNITFKCIDHLETIGFKNFYIQETDKYNFRPNKEQYYDSNKCKEELNKKKQKIDWGMIWCY